MNIEFYIRNRLHAQFFNLFRSIYIRQRKTAGGRCNLAMKLEAEALRAASCAEAPIDPRGLVCGHSNLHNQLRLVCDSTVDHLCLYAHCAYRWTASLERDQARRYRIVRGGEKRKNHYIFRERATLCISASCARNDSFSLDGGLGPLPFLPLREPISAFEVSS